ncbi:hypothetical protein JCM3775_006462 [Rhodotorula graminis]
MPGDPSPSPPRKPTPHQPPHASSLLGRRNRHKRTTDPIGPPTAVLDPLAYVERVEQALDEASYLVDEVEAGWAALDGDERARLKNRCSVADLLEQTSSTYDDSWARADIHQWTNFRWLPPPPLYPHEPQVDSDDDDGATPIALMDPQEEHKAWSGVTLEGHPDVERCFEAAEQSSLAILKPPQVWHFVRKSGLADYNALPALRPSKPGGPRPKIQDPLSHLLFTISFHCIPRINGVQSLSYRQVIVCTGSNTLEQLRANLTVGGDIIPVEEQDDVGSDQGEGDDDDDDDESMGRRGRGRGDSAGILGGEDGGDRTRWRNERRETGCAFVAEGLVYADDDENKQNYADLILAGIDQVDWPTVAATSSTPVQPSNDSDDELLPLASLGDASQARAAARAAAARPPVRPGDQGKPDLKAGPPLKDVKIGDMPLRVGQPYLYVHQGNNEHIWTVDEVRYLHPSDPPPFPPATVHPRSNAFQRFVSPYPLTTFLSRTLAMPRCSICRLDPGELHTVDDELSGETPAVLCRTCFDLLHPIPPDKRRQLGQGEAPPQANKRKRAATAADARAGQGGGPAQRDEEEVPDSERRGMDGVKVVPLLVEP